MHFSLVSLLLCTFGTITVRPQATDLECNGDTDFCALKFDQFSFAGSHSASSMPSRGCDGEIINECIYKNHGSNITAQLEFGIRYLSLEVCVLADDCNTDAYDTLDSSRLVSCKGNAEFGYRESLIEILRQVDEWMLGNPNEVIGIHFTRVIPEADWEPVFSGIVPLLEAKWGEGASNTSTGMNTYKSINSVWPTLRGAIEADERIFIFVDDELSQTGSIRPTWINPTPFSMPSLVNIWDGTCNSPGVIGHADLCNGTDDEELIVAIGYTLAICISNGQAACSGLLQNATDKCLKFRNNRTVNVLLVDFPDSNGSIVFEIVADLNQKNIERFILPDVSTQPTDSGTSTCTPYLPTCTGLEQFMVNTDTTLAECEYDECCITVTCNTVQEMFIDVIHSSTFTLIPCSTPPSIALTVRNSTEDIFTGNLSESGHTDVFVTQMASSDFVTVISLNITVDFSILGEVGIEVDLDQVTTNMASGILANGVTQVINELTRIPLDIASCNPTTISSTNSPTTSDSIRSCLSYHLVLLALLVCLLTHESLQWRPR